MRSSITFGWWVSVTERVQKTKKRILWLLLGQLVLL